MYFNSHPINLSRLFFAVVVWKERLRNGLIHGEKGKCQVENNNTCIFYWANTIWFEERNALIVFTEDNPDDRGAHGEDGHHNQITSMNIIRQRRLNEGGRELNGQMQLHLWYMIELCYSYTRIASNIITSVILVFILKQDIFYWVRKLIHA